MKIIISEIVKYVLLTIGTVTCLQDNNCEGMIIQKRKKKKKNQSQRKHVLHSMKLLSIELK